MEAAGALGRGSLSTYLEAIRALVRSRSRAFWIVAGLTVLAAVLRFATLGVQSYHHDEIVTASRVLRDGFWHAMDAVGFSESAPPLYYALAWLWTQVTGTGEVGLRSFSALAGVATVPIVYLLAAELTTPPTGLKRPYIGRFRPVGGSRTGIVAAALVAVNPMLVWYSQEARAYSLLVLLTSLSLLYFVRALDVPSLGRPFEPLGDGTSGRRRDLILWGVFSGLALATHYFAVFAIVVEAVWLLHRRGREAARGAGIVVAFGLALAPLAIHQMSYGHAEWIANHTLGHRLWELGVAFSVGEIGDIVARPERPLLALVPAAAMLVALSLLALRGERGERRAAAPMLAIATVAVAIPLALALLDSGKDYVLARNLLPALPALLVAVAVGLTLRRARRAGAILAAALVAYSLGFSVWASLSPALQRPGWDAVASTLGEPTTPRAMVTWTLGEASLRYYLSTGSFQAKPSEGFDWSVGEVDFISDGPAPPPPTRLLGPGFRQVGYERAGRLHIRRYARPGPGLAPLRLGTVREAELGFRTNGVLLDGIGPG
jgi:uncharacterized membrane protein